MRQPLESLDAFLEGPHQRALTQVVRKLLASGRFLTLAFGHGPSTERFIVALARHFPARQVNFALVEVEPVRVTMGPHETDARVIDAPDRTPTDLVRALLRQDPDAIAVTRLEGADPTLLLNTVFTGHQLLLGTATESVDAAVAALCAGSPGLEGQVLAVIDLACELDGAGRLRRLLKGDGKGGLREVARVDGASVVVDSALGVEVPPAPVAAAPRFAPALSSRPAPTRAPRPAFLPVTRAEPGTSLLGTRTAVRPAGSGWPTCRECGGPLALLVQLDLSKLPAPMPASHGLAQLFVCPTGGCELTHERSSGVLCEVVDGGVPVDAPAALSVEVIEPGAIVEWQPFAEDPTTDDLTRLGLATEPADEGPLRCDKLGGWPSWEQGLEWPLDEAGLPFELLFQLAEGAVLTGGTPDRWDDATATLVPGASPARVLDPNSPCHFPSVLTAEAVAFLFWQPGTRRLAFRWQTG